MKKSVLFSALILATMTIGCKKGDQGPAGRDGGGRVIATLNCAGNVSGLSGGAAVLNGIGVTYNAVLTAGGDVYATANVIDNSIQVSGTQFYAAGEAGSSNAEVDITDDLVGTANGGVWEISLDRNTLITTAIYDDVSLAAPVQLTFAASACSVANF